MFNLLRSAISPTENQLRSHILQQMPPIKPTGQLKMSNLSSSGDKKDTKQGFATSNRRVNELKGEK